MNKIQNFKHIERDPNYDKVHNPQRLTVAELTPVGVCWDQNGKRFKILKMDGVLAVPLNDLTGVAIVEGPFGTGPQNRAYISNADASVRFEIMKPTQLITSVFSDVYYIGSELCFFLSGPSGDYRLSINETDGTVSKINPSR